MVYDGGDSELEFLDIVTRWISFNVLRVLRSFDRGRLSATCRSKSVSIQNVRLYLFFWGETHGCMYVGLCFRWQLTGSEAR